VLKRPLTAALRALAELSGAIGWVPRLHLRPHNAARRCAATSRAALAGTWPPQLTIVAKLAPDFPLGQRLAAVTASTLRRVLKAITDPARQPWLEVVERTDAPATERALQPHPLTHHATTRPDQRHNNGAAADKLQSRVVEFSRVTRSHGKARLGQNTMPTGCANTCLRISSRTSGAMLR